MYGLRLRFVGAKLLVATALASVLAVCIGTPRAQAQFVCAGSANGLAPLGNGASVAGDVGAVACGLNANAGGGFSVALGTGGPRATAERSIAIGFEPEARGIGGIAIGSLALSGGLAGNGFTNENTIAIGRLSQAGVSADGQTGATAIGFSAIANALNGTAVGSNSNASFTNSAAFGNGAIATRANQQVFGSTTNTYTMSGITSTDSQAAQTGALQLVTTDLTGNLAGRTAASLGLASSTDIAGINSRLSGIHPTSVSSTHA